MFLLRDELRWIMDRLNLQLDTSSVSVIDNLLEVVLEDIDGNSLGYVYYPTDKSIKDMHKAVRTEESYMIDVVDDAESYFNQLGIIASVADEFSKLVDKYISVTDPIQIKIVIFDFEAMHKACSEVDCDICGSQMTEGWYHEDSGIKVCGEECGREQFEDFDERVNDVEDIMYTSFEEW